MKKSLFLHIGSHKTATTFIQSSLARNGPLLKDLGILYPKAGRIHQAHFKLCWALRDPANSSAALEDIEDWAALFEEIDAAPQQVVVLSSEEFGLAIDPRRLERLADRYDVSVIHYLRSPDSYLESFYNQVVKDFGTRESRTIESYITEEPLFFLETMNLLSPWEKMFGKDAVRLRLFGRKHLPNGILHDFLETLGCRRFPEFRPPDDAVLHKKSLPPDALEYLRLSNPWMEKEEGHHPFVRQLVELSLANESALQQTRAGLLSLRARQTLRKRFRDTNRQAARKFLDTGRTPFPPNETPSPPADFQRRLPEATPLIMGRIAAMIRDMR